MHEVHVDTSKNRLYVTIGKLEGREEMETIIEKISAACQELQPGFGCLTDLRDYEVGEEADEKYIFRGQKVMVDAGLKTVVRVRKQFGAWGHFQFDKSSVALGYHAQNVTSIKEAESILDAETGASA